MTDFENDTTAELIAPGRFGIRLSDRWWIGRGPNGGYVAALMLQAMGDAVGAEKDLADSLPPRSLSVHFLSPPAVGDGEIEVTFDDPGQYSLLCHEYCGIGHQTMFMTINVE